MKDILITDTKEKIEGIIREGAKIMLSADEDRNMQIDKKSGIGNFVTEYDLRVQKFLEEKFRALIPECAFLCEEDGEDENPLGDGLTFVIDPIDGTANFTRGRRSSCISVAILKNKQPIFGAVYDPYHDMYFEAALGEGSFCNGERLSVSTREVRESLASIGTAPYYRETMARPVSALFYGLLCEFADIRRIGAAAIELSSIAKGELDAFCEPILSPWDFAASAIIIKEAGGIITDFDGNEPTYAKPCPIVAASPATYSTIIRIINDNFKNFKS